MKEFKIGKYKISKDFGLFLLASIFLGIALAVDNTTFANRLYEDLKFTVMQRSMLETPRELPGLLTVFFIGMLHALGDIRIAAVANIIGGIGMLAFGFVPSNFGLVLICLMIYSTGQHIYLPLSASLSMSFAKEGSFGKRIGQVQSLGTGALIVSSGALYIMYKIFHMSYKAAFAAGGFAMIFAGVLFFFMDNHRTEKSAQRFIFRKQYALYYTLSIINGARKQLTLTFVPWLIIDTFKQPVTTITLLFFSVSAIHVFFKPWLGNLIDKKGERFVLMSEAVLLFIVCFGFAYAKTFLPFSAALAIACACYIIDNLLIAVSMARATYIRKIAVHPSDVSGTLSMGTTLDHVISMFIPLFAGYVWYSNGSSGYIYVFLGGAAISVLNFLIASGIKTGGKEGSVQHETGMETGRGEKCE